MRMTQDVTLTLLRLYHLPSNINQQKNPLVLMNEHSENP